MMDMEMLMKSPIGLNDVATKILSYLNFKDLRSARLVCKTWHEFLEEQPKLWLRFLRKYAEEVKGCGVWIIRRLSKSMKETDPVQDILLANAFCFRGDHALNCQQARIETYTLQTLSIESEFKVSFLKMLIRREIFDDSQIEFKDYLTALVAMSSK